MKATVTDLVGINYDIELRYDHDEDGIAIHVGQLPFPLTDLAGATIDILPAHTGVAFIGTDP